MKSRRLQVGALLAGAALAVGVPIAGCGKADDGMSQAQEQKADRLTEIAKRADGDWNKVPPADQQYVMQTFTSGSEAGAKMLILAKSGKFKGGPGAAPGGAPGH